MSVENTDDDQARLDNSVYAALSGAQSRFALVRGRAPKYQADVAPFFALPSNPSVEDCAEAVALVVPGTIAAIIHGGATAPEP
jgi:hypothetical protein